MTDARSSPLLRVSGLDVRFRTADGPLHAVKGIDFEVAAGETIALVGESGSGKSQAVMAIMGLTAANGTATGEALFEGRNLIGMDRTELNRLRGARLTMIFQEPMTSLDPLSTIGDQMALPLTRHGGLSRRAAADRAAELLDLVHVDRPRERLAAYPHQLSGGQRQRVMIAMAIANNPALLIADEPTTALDVTVQARILDLMAELRQRLNLAMIFISHDLNVVKRIADRTYVMRRGVVVERGPTTELFRAPADAYTRMLIDAEPKPVARPAIAAETAPVLSARDVKVSYDVSKGLLLRRASSVDAVKGVSLEVRPGETLGIVGESGSGKSTLGRALLKLVPARGNIVFKGRAIAAASADEVRPLRRQLQMVFQDPYGSLSPRLTAGQIVSEGLRVHEPHLSAKERDKRAAEAFEEVWLEAAWRNRFPHEFSGGQRQRLAIARAIMLRPELIVLDEPTSALDRSVQKGIVELLRYLQAKHALSYIFISHDLSVVRALSDRVMVMRGGLTVEEGPVDAIFDAPREDYTRELIAAALPD